MNDKEQLGGERQGRVRTLTVVKAEEVSGPTPTGQDEDFSGVSVLAEQRAEKTGDAASWTGRDAILSSLRSIDNDEYAAPHAIIVTMDDNGVLRWTAASDRGCTFLVGMLERAQRALLKTMDE